MRARSGPNLASAAADLDIAISCGDYGLHHGYAGLPLGPVCAGEVTKTSWRPAGEVSDDGSQLPRHLSALIGSLQGPPDLRVVELGAISRD
jgi:hypothetical protein